MRLKSSGAKCHLCNQKSTGFVHHTLWENHRPLYYCSNCLSDGKEKVEKSEKNIIQR